MKGLVTVYSGIDKSDNAAPPDAASLTSAQISLILNAPQGLGAILTERLNGELMFIQLMIFDLRTNVSIDSQIQRAMIYFLHLRRSR